MWYTKKFSSTTNTNKSFNSVYMYLLILLPGFTSCQKRIAQGREEGIPHQRRDWGEDSRLKRQSLCGRISKTQQCRKVLSWSYPPAAQSDTALHVRTPSDCSARSRSALMRPASANSGKALGPCHGCPNKERGQGEVLHSASKRQTQNKPKYHISYYITQDSLNISSGKKCQADFYNTIPQVLY